MDIQFENRYLGSDEMLAEYTRRVLCRKLTIMGAILCAVAALMLALTWRDHNIMLMTVFGVCLFLALFITPATPTLTFRQLKESGKRIHNGKQMETVVQFGDNIAMSEGTFALTVEYEQICRIYALRHSYVLMFGKTNAILLNPEQFTIGSFETFQPFIQAKCSNAR